MINFPSKCDMRKCWYIRCLYVFQSSAIQLLFSLLFLPSNSPRVRSRYFLLLNSLNFLIFNDNFSHLLPNNKNICLVFFPFVHSQSHLLASFIQVVFPCRPILTLKVTLMILSSAYLKYNINCINLVQFT